MHEIGSPWCGVNLIEYDLLSNDWHVLQGLMFPIQVLGSLFHIYHHSTLAWVCFILFTGFVGNLFVDNLLTVEHS